MRKFTTKITMTSMMLTAALLLGACGTSNNTANNSTVAEPTTLSVEETSVAAAPSEAETETIKLNKVDFVFVYDNMQIGMDQDIHDVLDKIGEPNSYFEAASCAFDGVDKTYTYTSFEITTYPGKDRDLISSIYFKDDTVKTAEGISLFMTQEAMEKAYGPCKNVDGNAYTYEKGNAKLTFIIEGGEIRSIEYQTLVAYLG